MATSSKNLGITIAAAIIAGVLGYFVGSRAPDKPVPLAELQENLELDKPLAHDGDAAPVPVPTPQAASVAHHGAWENKTQDELTMSLSKIMLPDEEYNKLGDAIYQTASGLLMAQAQSSGVEVSEATQQELKDSINKKYSRQYFADINANSMKELSKPELVAILSFYNTEPGQKFLTLSPKIIEATMASVQSDLSQWLPSTVEALIAKLKGSPQRVPAQERPKSN